jgi:hypothetical protein
MSINRTAIAAKKYDYHPCLSFSPRHIHRHSFIEPLGEYDDHDSTVIIVVLTLLIEISTNATRIHMTDVHQMHVIHSNAENNYTIHQHLLSYRVDLPCSIMPHAQTYAPNIEESLIVMMSR